MKEDQLVHISEELHKLNENVETLANIIRDGFEGRLDGGMDVTLYTDKPIMIKKED